MNDCLNENFYSRTEMLLGREGLSRLVNAKVIIFGVGGVGGYVLEALVRAGVGEIAIVDSDRVSESNLNRQIIATVQTIGKYKVDAAADRARSINPNVKITAYPVFYSPLTRNDFNLSEYDYVVDAIDSVREKVDLIANASEKGVRIISSMGAANKLDPTHFKIADISKTNTDPLARAVRAELRRRGINHLKVVFSDELPVIKGERVPASISFVPSAAGLIIASEIVKDIIAPKNQ